MSDYWLPLLILLSLSLGINILLLWFYIRIKRVLQELNRKALLSEDIFYRLPMEALLLRKGQVIKMNQRALENLGSSPQPSEIKKIFEKKGKKIEIYEVNLDSEHKVLLVMDITEQESLKEAYQIALSYLSHELKTPFAIAYGYLERLENLLHKRIEDGEIKTLFEKTKESFQRLEKLLKKLFSGIDYLAKEIKVKQEKLSLKEIIEEALFWVTPLAEEKRIHLAFEVMEGLTIVGSPELLTQAFFNIIENAVKASPHGEVVQIQALVQNSKKISIVIRDRGPGVTPEKLPLLGMPFFKLKESEGMGLGLFITKRIIEAHGGVLRFNLPREGGLEVHIILPLA